MKIDFSAEIIDLKGEPVKEGDKADSKHLTLAAMACTALMATYADEQNLSGEEKVKRFRIAQAIVDGGEQDLKVEDVATLKKLIGRAFAPLFVGRAFDIIEPPKTADRDGSIAA